MSVLIVLLYFFDVNTYFKYFLAVWASAKYRFFFFLFSIVDESQKAMLQPLPVTHLRPLYAALPLWSAFHYFPIADIDSAMPLHVQHLSRLQGIHLTIGIVSIIVKKPFSVLVKASVGLVGSSTAIYLVVAVKAPYNAFNETAAIERERMVSLLLFKLLTEFSFMLLIVGVVPY